MPLIIHGDCLTVLPTLESESFHACVTDPPYHLVSQDKRPATRQCPHAHRRVPSGGFMGQAWDGGDLAFRPETWAAVYRVLKPGAHLLAFGGTRTFHRLACAIEDAGFEIRDTIIWLYGSGFPKSHDVSKAIDARGGANLAWFGLWFRKWREERGITQKQVAALFPSKSGGLTGCVANWELGFGLPTPEQFNLIKDTFSLPFDSIEAAERAVVDHNDRSRGWFTRQDGHDITEPTTEAARQWQGWGTALKPACELICVARKPLSEGTVAANVLRHGTGALNIDSSRVATDESTVRKINTDVGMLGSKAQRESGYRPNWHKQNDVIEGGSSAGRWPANVAHDGSPEVMGAFARFGQKDSCGGNGEASHWSRFNRNIYSGGGPSHNAGGGLGDTGTAARFFYTAKADASERVGSHPTVKPVALMEWLVGLVTPPGGRVLDPFCGTGSTLVACDRPGFDAVGIEQDAQTVADAHEKIRRMRARRAIGAAPRFDSHEGQLSLLL